MKKVLILASLFYPQKNGGGPTVSIMNLVKSISRDFEVYVITKNYEVGDTKPLDEVKPGWNEFDFGKVYYFNYEDYTFKNVYKLIKEINADVIYQNSFFSYETAIPAAFYKKSHKCKFIIAPRGEFSSNAFRMKKGKKSLYFNFFKLFGLFKDVYMHTTGDDETTVVQAMLKNDKIKYYNIPNISVAGRGDSSPLEKQPGKLKMVYIARIHKVKNLLFGLERLKNVKGEVEYDVYGPLEDKLYWDECIKVIDTLPETIKVNYCGKLEQSQVAEKLKENHLFYMPTLSENYGHSIVEAMLWGRPVVISNQTPWTGLWDNKCGFDIDLKDEKGFETALQAFIDMDMDEYITVCENAKKYINGKLDSEKILKQYIEMFNE